MFWTPLSHSRPDRHRRGSTLDAIVFSLAGLILFCLLCAAIGIFSIFMFFVGLIGFGLLLGLLLVGRPKNDQQSPRPSIILSLCNRFADWAREQGSAEPKAPSQRDLSVPTTRPGSSRELVEPGRRSNSSTTRPRAKPPSMPKEPTFYGPGLTVHVGRGDAIEPLVYAVRGTAKGEVDASLIETGLSVASSRTPTYEELPYWPTYRGASPAQRARYLDWLLLGRRDADIPIGYVFIYFYGLERRVLLDRTDHEPILRELRRLLEVYDMSPSFQRYATNLAWATLLLSAVDGDGLDEAFLKMAESSPPADEDTLAVGLAYSHVRELPLPASLARSVAEWDSRTSTSVVIRRHTEMFSHLFDKRYAAACGRGLVLKESKRPHKLAYQPASPTLSGMLASFEVPNALGLPSQFKPLIQIWSDCIDELKAYDRAHRSSAGEELTAAMYEALPEELRTDDHPELGDWRRVMRKYAGPRGWPLVPVSALASIKGFPTRSRLTKRQCETILCTADAIGFGLEPDARLTGRNYEWNELLSVFRTEGPDQEDLTAYSAAAVLLRLGMCVAAADGRVDKEELRHVSQHLEDHFSLKPAHRKRLKALARLLRATKSFGEAEGKKLRTSLPVGQRRMVASYLVGIAAVDQEITPEEVKALKKLYRILGLAPDELTSLLVTLQSPAEPEEPVEIQRAPTASRTGERIPPPPARRGFGLNMEAVNRIMAETSQVAEVLAKAMSERNGAKAAGSTEMPREESSPTDGASDAASDDGGTQAAPLRAVGLDDRFHEFLDVLVTKDAWARDELSVVAREHSLMLNGALEAINEWSEQQYGDWLVEQGETIAVRLDVFEDN